VREGRRGRAATTRTLAFEGRCEELQDKESSSAAPLGRHAAGAARARWRGAARGWPFLAGAVKR
jgi:hypothetical protein